VDRQAGELAVMVRSDQDPSLRSGWQIAQESFRAERGIFPEAGCKL